jgi:hypothetical protein
MSYYTYVVAAKQDTDFILHDDFNVDEHGRLSSTFHFMNQFSDEDYEFIKMLWKKSNQTKKLKYDFQAAVKLTKDVIEEWEFFKKDTWFYRYDEHQHLDNLLIIEEQNNNGLNVYICVR